MDELVAGIEGGKGLRRCGLLDGGFFFWEVGEIRRDEMRWDKMERMDRQMDGKKREYKIRLLCCAVFCCVLR